MAASKLNYIIVYKHYSQIYGCASKKIALESPPPPEVSLSDKKVFFITYHPDLEEIVVHQLPQEEILSAVIKTKEKKENDSETEDIITLS